LWITQLELWLGMGLSQHLERLFSVFKLKLGFGRRLLQRRFYRRLWRFMKRANNQSGGHDGGGGRAGAGAGGHDVFNTLFRLRAHYR
jgi:hypothetical protein